MATDLHLQAQDQARKALSESSRNDLIVNVNKVVEKAQQTEAEAKAASKKAIRLRIEDIKRKNAGIPLLFRQFLQAPRHPHTRKS